MCGVVCGACVVCRACVGCVVCVVCVCGVPVKGCQFVRLWRVWLMCSCMPSVQDFMYYEKSQNNRNRRYGY